MKRTIALLVSLLMLLAVFAGCAGGANNAAGGSDKPQTETSGGASSSGNAEGTQSTGPVRREQLRVALSGQPDTLDPYASSNTCGLIATLLVYERLLRTDEEGNIIPWLATEYEMLDDTTLRFVLRDDVYFHDGSKFTAEDAAFSLKTAAESSFTANLFGSIDPEGFEIKSDTELIVKLLSPNAAILKALSSNRGVMISKNYYENAAAEDVARKPMGTGPMVFEEWVVGDHYSFTKNENYWGDELAYDSVLFRFITESSSRCIELETGGVDIAQELAFSDWDRIDQNPKTKLIKGDTLGTRFLVFNQNVEFLRDYNVRKALAYALDFEAIVNVVWQGNARVADSYYSPAISGHKAVGPQEYNPEKAREYLALAGYNESNPLKFTYYTYENTVNITLAEMVQQMWAAVGIEAEVSVTDLSSFTTMNNNGELTVTLLSTTASIADPTAALLIWPITRTISVRHGDQHIQDLLDAGVATYDQAERDAIYGELQDYLWEKFYAVPVCYPQEGYGCASYVKNLPFYPNTCFELDRVTFSE